MKKQQLWSQNRSFTITLLLSLLFVGCASGPSGTLSDAVEPTPDNEEDAQTAIAAGVPDTDIYLFEIDAVDPTFNVQFLYNATKRTGYDNQPFFLPLKNDFYFSRISDGTQSDIYYFEEESRTISPVTQTPVSEYSPTPLVDGSISSVTVEADGTQRLWRYTALGSPLGKFRKDVTAIGYHAWLDNSSLAVFIVDEPLRLEILELASKSVQRVAENIGRALHRIPNSHDLSYVQKFDDQLSVLMRWNKSTGRSTRLITMPEGVEDLAWLPGGQVLTTFDGELLMWNGQGSHWQVIYDLTRSIDGDITRLAVNDSATRLAVVATTSRTQP